MIVSSFHSTTRLAGSYGWNPILQGTRETPARKETQNDDANDKHPSSKLQTSPPIEAAGMRISCVTVLVVSIVLFFFVFFIQHST